MDKKDLTERKRAEIDVWDGLLRRKVRHYVEEGMSIEAAEQKAAADIGREIARS